MAAKTYFSQEALQTLFDMLAEGWSMPKASAIACGTSSKAPWCWIRNAKRERNSGVKIEEAKHVIRDWPEPNDLLWLDDAFQTSQDMMKLNLSSQAIEEVMQSRTPILDGSGNVSFQLDYKALADWRGDKELARELGGLSDPFFAHDENGARIPLTKRAEIPSAMRIAALKAMAPQTWDRPTTIDVNKRTMKAVYVLKDHRRDQKPDTPLVEDMKTRYARLREGKSAHDDPRAVKKPIGAVPIMKADPMDPPEKISSPMSDDASRPLPEPPRALPAPTKQPESQPNYGRRRTSSLDAVDRATSGGGSNCGMPPGGFDSKGRPT
jgi:hypothetical protein